jgi:hypothetical protein
VGARVNEGGGCYQYDTKEHKYFLEGCMKFPDNTEDSIMLKLVCLITLVLKQVVMTVIVESAI